MTVINKDIEKQKEGKKVPLIYLDSEKLDQLICNEGVRVRVYTTAFCPNIKSIGGPHNINCTLCRDGFVDRNPVETIMFIQSQLSEKMMLVDGYVDNQASTATFLSGTELQYGTRIDLIDFADIYFQVVQKQASGSDKLKYSAISVNLLIDQNGVEYREGTDFSLDVNGDIKWDGTSAPATEVIYSVHYNIAVSYRTLKALHVNRYGKDGFKQKTDKPKKLNEQWVIKRRYLFTRDDYNGLPINDNQIINDI